MIFAFASSIFNKLRGWMIALAAGVMLALSIYAKGRKEGRDQATLKAVEESNRRVEKGAKGAQQAREAQDQGRTPEDGVRSRDGRWR